MNSEVLTFQAHFHLEKNKIFLKENLMSQCKKYHIELGCQTHKCRGPITQLMSNLWAKYGME